MRISTSTNIFAANRDGSLTDIKKCIKQCADLGYKVLDLNLRFIHYKDFFLVKDDWRKETDIIANIAAKNNIEFTQSHIPYYKLDQDDKYLTNPVLHEWQEKMCRRALHVSSILNIKWATIHTFTDIKNNCEIEASKKKNIEYLSPYLELAEKLNVGIAIENMCDFLGSRISRQYACNAEELIDLVDSLNTNKAGICWDFGHANIMKLDQCKSLEMIGNRLKATHVNDNFNAFDSHNIPFMGTVKWENIMSTLKNIKYQGDLAFEVHGAVDHVPEKLKENVARLAYEIGQYLLEI